MADMEHFVNRCVSLCLVQLFTVLCAKSTSRSMEWLWRTGSYSDLVACLKLREWIVNSFLLEYEAAELQNDPFVPFVTVPSRTVSSAAIIKCRWQKPLLFAKANFTRHHLLCQFLAIDQDDSYTHWCDIDLNLKTKVLHTCSTLFLM